MNSEEELLKVVVRLEKLEKDKIEGKKDYINKIEQEKMVQLRSLKLHGQFERDTDNKKSEKSWQCLRNGNLKRETEIEQNRKQTNRPLEPRYCGSGKEYQKMFDN